MAKKAVLLLLLFSIFLFAGCTGAFENGSHLILVDGDFCRLSTGEQISVWRYPRDNKLIYRLGDGTELLAVVENTNLVHVSAEGSESLSELSRNAQNEIIEFYSHQDAPYRIEEYLEKAYAEYSIAEPNSNFRCYLIEREIRPSGSNEKIVYFSTYITLPLGRGAYDFFSITQAFDRETGEALSGWELFSGSEDDVINCFFSQYAEDANLMRYIYETFDPRYIRFDVGGYEIIYPSAIHGEGGEVLKVAVGGEYTDEIVSVLHSWAIPTSGFELEYGE